MGEVKVHTEAQALVAPFRVHPPMEEVHLQKTFEVEQTEAGLSIQGDQQVKKHESGGTNIKTFRQMANNDQRSIRLRYSKKWLHNKIHGLAKTRNCGRLTGFPKNANCNRRVDFKTSYLSSRNSEFKNSRLLQ